MERFLRVHPSLFEACGNSVTEAIVLSVVADRIYFTSESGNKDLFVNGKWWCPNTKRSVVTYHLGIYSYKQVKKALASLVSKRFLECAYLGDHKYDKAAWYALTDKAEKLCGNTRWGQNQAGSHTELGKSAVPNGTSGPNLLSKTGPVKPFINNIINNINNNKADKSNNDSANTVNYTPPISPSKGDSPNGVAPSSSFAEFWNAYPRKVGVSVAKKIWCKREKELSQKLPLILSYISQQIATNEWQPKDAARKKFIPHPSTFLNQNRWEDLEEAQPSASSSTPAAAGWDSLSKTEQRVSITAFCLINESEKTERGTKRTKAEWTTLWQKYESSKDMPPICPLLLKND